MLDLLRGVCQAPSLVPELRMQWVMTLMIEHGDLSDSCKAGLTTSFRPPDLGLDDVEEPADIERGSPHAPRSGSGSR